MVLRCFRKIALTPLFLALPAAAAYDANGVALGASEQAVKRQFPSAHCKPLEWSSSAAERRCDESKAALGGVEVRITFYLKKDAVQAFDVRFDSRDADRLAAFLKSRYGKPAVEQRETIERPGKQARRFYRVRWENGDERALLVAQPDRRRSSLTVSRGDFEEQIYRVR
jgi:hypothetical protein